MENKQADTLEKGASTRPSEKEIADSLRSSVRDGVAYSVMMGAGETYFSAFALFLKATTQQVGFLSALPPLIGSFVQLFSAWLGHIVGSRRQIILMGVSLQALSWIPLFVLPLVFPDYAVFLLTLCLTLYFAVGNLAVPQWSSLMGDLVDEKQRGRYFALRNRLMSISHFIALIGAGALLHYFEQGGETLTGYALVFIAAIAARLVSVYFLSRMVDPPGHVATLEWKLGKEGWKRISGSPFFKFALFIALMNCMVGIASPYFAVYLLRDLQFSYFAFMTVIAASMLAQFLTFNSWGRLGDAFGNRLILVVTGCIVSFVPAAWVFSENLAYLIVIQALTGFFWAGFNLSAANFLYDLVPASKRVTYLAVHNVLAALGVFLGISFGGWLVSFIESALAVGRPHFSSHDAFYTIFLISTLGRFIVFAAFLSRIKEVRPTRPLRASAVVLRATRSPALAGLVFEYGGARQRRKNLEEKNPISRPSGPMLP